MVHYQPIVQARSGRPVSAEALMRWRDPESEQDDISTLICAAEQSPVIYGLERWAVKASFDAAAAWQKRLLPSLRVNVNLSAREFDRPRFTERIKAFAKKSRVDPARVTLEITETSTIHQKDAAARLLSELKDIGFQVWLDDFGTGHSSLDWLWRLPVDGVKIPGTFIEDVVADENAAIITSAVIDLAHRLKLRVVAEGIETEEQRQWLLEAGCDELQGYLLHRPMPAEDLVAALTR